MNLLENIIESFLDGIIAVDNSFHITIFNQSAERITDISASSSLNEYFTDVFQKDKWLYGLLDKTVKEGKVFNEYEGDIFQRLGRVRHVSASTTPVFGDDGGLVGAVLTLKDLSRIKPIEDDSMRTERLAMIGQFAASLAHEVKNPLGGIRGAAQLLGKRLKEKEWTEYTDLIIRESDRLNRLLEDILDFSNPKRLNPAAINIHKILDDIVMLQGNTLIEKGISLIKEYDPSIPFISGDYSQLTQVFLNIVKNSIEAVRDKGEIRISTRIGADFHLVERGTHGKMAEVRIKDNGSGIKKEDIEKIFTPFFTTKKKGSGLGLAISIKIVKEHNGFFRIDSAYGKGTDVSILLPIAHQKEKGNE